MVDVEFDYPFYYDLIAGKSIKKQQLKQTKMVIAPNWRWQLIFLWLIFWE